MNLATPLGVYLLEQDTDITEIIKNLCDEKALQLHCFNSGDELLAAFVCTTILHYRCQQ